MTYNGFCNCDECHASPAPPVPHLPRLEAEGDVWGVTRHA